MSATGIGMLLRGMGIDPATVTKQVTEIMGDVAAVRAEMDRQGRLLNAIARANNINPADFDADTTKEIDL